MEIITQDNLTAFRPEYDEYTRRRIKTAGQIGVESTEDLKTYREEFRNWNRESKIGFSAQEENILALILLEEQGNRRFNSNKFIDEDFGGNTAEHPIFMGHKIDYLRDNAGFGPGTFDGANPRTLEAARLSQKLHAMSAVHDIGELMDIAYSEQKLIGATKKEPDEEKLVGPFKLTLAAYAISSGDPMFYVRTMHEARQRINERKKEIFNETLERQKDPEVDKKESGNACIDAIGKEIQIIIDDTLVTIENAKGPLHSQLRPEYREALAGLTGVFEEAQAMNGFSGAMFNLIDKYEGDSHYRHFIGKSRHPYAEDSNMVDRAFNGGRSLSYALASSDQVLGDITYSQKVIPAVLSEADKLEAGPAKDVAVAFARAGAAAILRNHIRILQKAPALLDLTKADNKNAVFSKEAEAREGEFVRRLEMQGQLLGRIETKHYPVTTVGGVMDTKTLIAVIDKMASAIENGTFKPKAAPFLLGELPANLQVTLADVRHAIEKYPSAVAKEYGNSREAVSAAVG